MCPPSFTKQEGEGGMGRDGTSLPEVPGSVCLAPFLLLRFQEFFSKEIFEDMVFLSKSQTGE